MSQSPVEVLERQPAEILRQMQNLGDMRRGSVVEQYLKCGKVPCRCKQPGERGHGPYFTFTRKVEGKTQTRQFRAGPRLTKLQREVETFPRFQALRDRLLAMNEKLCELRPEAGEAGGETEVKKTSRRSWKGKSSKKWTD